MWENNRQIIYLFELLFEENIPITEFSKKRKKNCKDCCPLNLYIISVFVKLFLTILLNTIW